LGQDQELFVRNLAVTASKVVAAAKGGQESMFLLMIWTVSLLKLSTCPGMTITVWCRWLPKQAGIDFEEIGLAGV